MSKYIANFHRQLIVYKERYKDNYAKRSWHTFCYLLRHWFGNNYKFKRCGQCINIGFITYGGIGDIVILGAYINKFLQKLDCNSKVYLFVAESVDSIKLLFGAYKSVLEVCSTDMLQRTPMDIVLHFEYQFPEIYFYRKEYIIKKSQFLKDYISKIDKFNTTYKHLFESESLFAQQILTDILEVNRISGMDPTNMLNLTATDSMKIIIPDDSKSILGKYNLIEDKFITFAYNLDVLNKSKTSTRLWSGEYLQKLILMIKKQYPQYKIVQLGTKSLFNFDNIDVNLVGKTSFSEFLAILNASKLHIDAECGMVHLRHALCAKTSIVLYGPTSISTKGYPENVNIRSNICNCPCCEGLIGYKWQSFCIKTNSNVPACMSAITVEEVLSKIEKFL